MKTLNSPARTAPGRFVFHAIWLRSLFKRIIASRHVIMPAFAVLLLGLENAVTFSAFCQSADGFNPNPNHEVLATAVQPDGKILVGGNFLTLGGQMRNYLARLGADGTVDTGFNPGADSALLSLAVQRDGKALLGGFFTQLAGQYRYYLGRLNADGSLDMEFNPGANSVVLGLLLQADGKVVVGGHFTTLGGQSRNRIGRLNVDGTLDTTFDPGADGGVLTMALQADGKILVGGEFTHLGGQPRNYLCRLNSDGTPDSYFFPNVNGNVSALAVQSDGKILVGGDFSVLSGQNRNHIARLNPDGSVDTSFNPGANGAVYSLVLNADGDIIVAGNFTTFAGTNRNYIARVKADGTLDASFDPGANSVAAALALQVDGKILVGGYFTAVGGQPRNYLARLTNGIAAVQSLEINSSGDTITWSRSGSGPEIQQVTFEKSSDGISYTMLGDGTRVIGGWRLTGLTLPGGQTFYLRARGRTGGGYFNGSSGIIEVVRQFFIANCNYSLLPTSACVSSSGGNGVVSVTAPAGCIWTASSSYPWIKIISGETGIGNGTVLYAVSSSPDEFSRFGSLTIAGQFFSIAQAGYHSCLSYSISSTNQSFSAAGGSTTVDVLADYGCSWLVSSPCSFVTISPTNGCSSGSVTVTVAPNPTASPRSCTNWIAGRQFVVAQAAGTGCVFAISPSSGFFSAGGGTTSVAVTASNGCSWTAASPCPFVTVTPSSGMGPGVVTVTVAQNPVLRARSCTNIIAGQEYVVNQVEGSGCIYSVSPTSATFPSAGGSTNVQVGVNSGCFWSASSPCPFVTILPPSGTGPAIISVTVATNAGSFRECELTIARQSFTVTQAGAAGGLDVTVASNEFTIAPGRFRLVAPSNTINLQAIFSGNTDRPTFQWCRENQSENGTTLYDDVVFTSPNSSNTTVMLDYAGTYDLSVRINDGSHTASANVTVTAELNPNGVFDKASMSNLLHVTTTSASVLNSNKFLTYGGFGGSATNINSDLVATAYYQAIDPSSNKMTFAAWKIANGITTDVPPVSTGAVVSATYFNALDLGFGRRMIMKTNSNGEAAFAVSNFTNVNDAVSGTGLIATVAMEYSSVTNGGPRFTKFYVFGADGNRVNQADLDGAGAKSVPGLCIVCHGGQTSQTIPYANSGNVGAHFLPFDLRAFSYNCDPAFAKAAQQSAFRELNRGVLQVERSLGNRPALTNLIEGWYGGPTLPGQIQDEDFVPNGWKSQNRAVSVPAQAYLYRTVVAPSCRSCHITRELALLDFDAFDDFQNLTNFIKLAVFGTNSLITPVTLNDGAPGYPVGTIRMPHARRTFERFWNSISPRPQPEILRDYLLGRLNDYVTPQVTDLAGTRIGNDLLLSFTTSNGGSYRLEQTDDLTPPVSSTPINGAISGNGSAKHIILPMEPGQKRFFRVRSLP